MKKKTIRQLKKQNDMARCVLFADKIGTIERGIWSAYFHKHPSDYKKVRKFLKKSGFFKCLVNDYKKFYKHPGFNLKTSDKIIERMENVYAIPYLRLKKLGYGCEISVINCWNFLDKEMTYEQLVLL